MSGNLPQKEHKEITPMSVNFPNDLVAVYAVALNKHSPLVCEVLDFIHNNPNRLITVSVLAQELKTTRRVAVKSKGKIVNYEYRQGVEIGRAKAERIVENLICAGMLLDNQDNPPHKLLSITARGEQVRTFIRRYREVTKGGETK